MRTRSKASTPPRLPARPHLAGRHASTTLPQVQPDGALLQDQKIFSLLYGKDGGRDVAGAGRHSERYVGEEEMHAPVAAPKDSLEPPTSMSNQKDTDTTPGGSKPPALESSAMTSREGKLSEQPGLTLPRIASLSNRNVNVSSLASGAKNKPTLGLHLGGSSATGLETSSSPGTNRMKPPGAARNSDDYRSNNATGSNHETAGAASNNHSNNTIKTGGRRQMERQQQGQMNNLFVQLLENVELDDQAVVTELVQTLMQICSDNETLKSEIWGRIDSLSEVVTDTQPGRETHAENMTEHPNSLLYDCNLSNAELRTLLQEQRQYNQKLAQTVDEFEDAIDTVLEELTVANKKTATEILSTVIKEEKSVQENTEEMWDSWADVVSAMEEIRLLENSVVDLLEGL